MIKKKFWLLLILISLLIAGGWLIKDKKEEKVEQVEQVEEKVGEVNLILNFGEGKASTYSAKISEETSVLDLLKYLAKKHDFSLETKESDFGVLVEEINGVRNSQDHFWMYYVNDQLAEVGAGQYQLKPGDVVEWKYEEITP